MPILVSVVVCTYNRAEILKGAIESLCSQTADSSLYEIIVVDNNSTDDTQKVVERFAHFGNVLYYPENRQGLSHARNRGWQAAQGEYVAYIDDDAKASPDWVERIIDAFESVEPQPVAVGGEIHPWYETTPPQWYTDDFEIRSWGKDKGFLESPKAQSGFSGSNMAFKKSILESYKGFSSEYGMVGSQMRLGDETALFYRIYQNHPLFWYDPDIKVEHWVPSRNMTISYLLRRYFHGGESSIRIHLEGSRFIIIKKILRFMFESIVFPFRVKWWDKNWQRSFLKHARPVCTSLGSLKGLLF
jgi:glycosyltransferase involved in cell wall biosynthesis